MKSSGNRPELGEVELDKVLQAKRVQVLDEKVAFLKKEVIARALIHKGITVWEGIPEHIIEELSRSGYQIRKTKKLKKKIKAARAEEAKSDQS